METFLDGGLFELLIGIFFASLVNIIFSKKYLLIFFSIMVVASPIILLFINKNELYYWLVSFCFFNSSLLIILLWKERAQHPAKPLFRVDAMKNKITVVGKKMKGYFAKDDSGR